MSDKKLQPPICPYCNVPAVFVSSTKVYGRFYGMLWLCPNYPTCDTYVGCHRKSNLPFGTMANKELRQARMNAHSAFDRLWNGGAMRRDEAYEGLAKRMGIPASQCHIAMFDLEQCRQVVELVESNIFQDSEVHG